MAARRCWRKSGLARRLFGAMVRRITDLPVAAGWTAAGRAHKQEAGEGEVSMKLAVNTGIADFSVWRKGEIRPAGAMGGS